VGSTIAAILVAILLEDAHVIPNIEPMQGPDPTVGALARAIRAANDPAVTDTYLFGVTGAAFLATVCANNCNCREWRELSLRLDPTLRALGVPFEKIEGSDDATWAKVKASIDDGVPVVGWNPLGDYEDAVITGYDVEKDLLYGWGAKPAGKEYATGKLSEWRSGGMSAYILKKGALPEVDRKALELASLRGILAFERRPEIEGG